MKKTLTLLSMIAMLELTGCSTIFGDNQRVVQIDSAPKGAKVSVNSMELEDRTPTETVVTNMWSPTVIKVQKSGCTSKTVTISPEFQTIGILNIFFPPAFIVDAVTGNMMKIPNNQRKIDMKLC